LEFRIDYERVLNPAQLEAVEAMAGPILVIAGAGSGKTRTLVYRVARLVETGVPPESILLLTFTRKAAQEMLERAGALSDPRCRLVSGGTFHGLANRVLRSRAELLNFDNAFTILDRPDMEEVIRSLVPRLGIPKGSIRFPRSGTLANILSKAANLEVPVDGLMEEEYGQFLHCVPEVARLAGLYVEYKRSHQMMDYDDLLLNLRRLLAEHPEVRKGLSRQYRYVMVDEYQDTNRIQAEIVIWLARDHRNIMVVGDDAQSIYSFRGANYQNMFDFSTAFPEAKTIKLEENYRSTQPILTMANALMDQASEKHTKCLFTKRTGGERPRVADTRTEPEQALYLCQTIREAMERGSPLSDLAVLFRAGYHAFELEAELTRQGIPYVKYGGFKFLESAHIKDFLAHLRVVVNKGDILSWLRILRLVKNVGQGRSQAIVTWLRHEGLPPEALDQWPGAGPRDEGLRALATLMSILARNKTRPKKAAEQVLNYYVPILKGRFDDHPRRERDLEQLILMASRYKKMRNFLDDLILEPPNSAVDMGPESARDRLTLSTVHSAKGLEWSTVFIIWVMEGRFPAAKSYKNRADLEEERRLMYVAATRAKDRLILCYPGQDYAPAWHAYDRDESRYGNGLSSFIRSLSQDVVAHESVGAANRAGEGRPSPIREQTVSPVGPKSASGLSQGDRVEHPAFGPGVVSKFVGDDKVEVLFRNVGRKLLHLDYTTLEKV
jgi:DNA helicase-2/ATP-dependent DNA helicase PcrA